MKLKMALSLKISLSIYFFITRCSIGFGEIILTEDKEYDIIDFKIPQAVWKQAFRPTPVLKSQATIVLPIHVSQEEDNDIEEFEDEVTEVNNIADTTIVNDEQVIQDEISVTNVSVTDVTQSPVVQDVQEEVITTPAPASVTGQVIRFPCSCVRGQCGCCTGTILERLRMKACGNITFVPEDFVFDVRMSVNNNTVVRRRVSASDPPPICFNPRRAPFVRVCAEISNIRIRNRNAFACLDISADIAEFPIYSASFRCFGLGTSGVQTGLKPKPISSGPPTVNLFGNGDDDDRGSFLENAAGAIFGGDEGGLFGRPSGGLFGGGSDDDDGGPLDAIGDVVGDLFDGRKID